MKKHLKGQFYLAFLTMAVPVFLLMMVIVVDFGNFLTMRSMVRSLADSSALAAAGAVDMGGKDGSSGGTEKGSSYTLNARWARARAEEVFRETVNGNQPKYMSAGRTDFTLSVSVSGKRATATVTGIYQPLWANLLGADPLQTTATSTAEAATGIGGPV